MPRKSLYPTYYGKHEYEETTHPDCPRTIGGRTADEYVWSKVCEILAQPDVLIGEAQKHVENLRQQWADSQAEKERLEKELEAALTERQWVITQARKGRIKDSDMDTQIASLDIQETEIKRELNSLKAAVELQALEDWEAQVREYLANLQAGVESLNTPPQNDEEAQQQYEDKRRIVQTLVERVQIGKDRELKVTFKLDVIAAIKQLANFCENWQVGICSRIPDLTNSGRVRVTL